MPTKPAHTAALVFYAAAMLLFFGFIGQAILLLVHAQPVPAAGDVAVALGAWWVGAGVATRLGVSPSAFLSRLGWLLERYKV